MASFIRMLSAKNSKTTIAFLASLQVLDSTYFLYIPNFYAANSVLFLLCGVGITILLLRIPPLQFHSGKILTGQLVLKLLFVVLLTPVSYQLARNIMDHTPLQIEYADMLPIIKTMCERFLNGEWKQVYQPIPGIWNGIKPIYLPGMWLPFTPALIFDFDLRWITVCGIWLSIILCLLPGWRNGWVPALLITVVLVLLSWFHFDELNNVVRLTEEGVVFFYFSLLTLAIISFNPWLLGLSAALCLMSRYSLVGWIPFAVLFFLVTKQYSFLLKTIGASFLVIL
ncbi:MAG TPA: hypothetical protein VFP87_15670, partial [Chitinophagaceae bacterium]|nr:hypothetical protein [Chitinophagaceae bacterium]